MIIRTKVAVATAFVLASASGALAQTQTGNGIPAGVPGPGDYASGYAAPYGYDPSAPGYAAWDNGLWDGPGMVPQYVVPRHMHRHHGHHE